MAENCRKLFPSATRQRRSCLEAIKIATFVRNSYSLFLSQPVTTVAASVFVLRTSSAPSNAVYVPLENSDKNDKSLDNVPEQRKYTLKKTVRLATYWLLLLECSAKYILALEIFKLEFGKDKTYVS